MRIKVHLVVNLLMCGACVMFLGTFLAIPGGYLPPLILLLGGAIGNKYSDREGAVITWVTIIVAPILTLLLYITRAPS